jgi:asparagine synthase (glutamine-hydrolysing)
MGGLLAMCGIAGWLGHLADSEIYATQMQRALHHRGPDGHGAQLWEEAGLVHTRLSILDLSFNGQQPMSNENGTVWTVFNGEIYNHRDLRRDLESRGHVFKGRSDSEVLPHLYEEDGAEFVGRLRGMFALAVYDTKTRTLMLTRDRFGIKPLFYAPIKDRLAFASEIRALLIIPGIDLHPDKQAIYDFAALFHIPAPETFYTGIRALEPGEVLEGSWDGNSVIFKIQKYHSWSITPDSEMTLSKAIDRADELITTAVKKQLESDVALGSLLSGGIDSSLVSAAAQNAIAGGIATFNAKFSEKQFDETWAAVAVANHIGSDHQTLFMQSDRGTWDDVIGLLRHAGQPFADTSLFAVNAVCRLMRSHVTVALSGDGGDEAFGGYDAYWRIAQIARCQKVPVQFWRGAAALLDRLAQLGFITGRIPRRVRDLTGADDTSIIQTLWCWIRDEEHQRLCRDMDALPVRRLFEPQWCYNLPKETSRLGFLSAQLTEVNTRLILPNDYLFKVDTASMKESLEVRVPMLDEDLFAFGIALPHHLKVKAHTGKRILREVAKRKLPKIVAAKPKQGFKIPVDTWVSEDFKERVMDCLLGTSTKLSEFFRPEVYRPIIQAFCDNRPHPGISREGLYQRTVMLLGVQLMLQDRSMNGSMPYAA